ncbi:putative methyltransferase-domain-containing protein [Mycena amicta]|nr:putative methyltransferase-domain-containing protein [Mycena amicta]
MLPPTPDPADPPSLRLPPLRGIEHLSVKKAIECIEYLQNLYTPQIRGSSICGRLAQDGSSVPWSSPVSVNSSTVDEFERRYSIRWLTYLTHNGDRLQGSPEEIAYIVDRAAAVLANCGGASSAGVLTRNLNFPSTSGGINVVLRDIPLYDGMASVGAQTWGGACVLAELIVSEPGEFGLKHTNKPLRVLELGSGTGLVGITFAKMAQQLQLSGTIICTDAYPPALDNLAVNISANFSSFSENISVTCLPLDWATIADVPLSTVLPPPLDTPFNLIVGADIIYEAEHASWIRKVLTRLLATTHIFHLVIPLRRTHSAESSTVESVFIDNDDGPTILYQETIVCDVEENPGEEVEYVYYRIGWRTAETNSGSNSRP